MWHFGKCPVSFTIPDPESPSMRSTSFDPWRVFYRVEGQTVTVELIGQKKGNVLLIGGKEFKL